MIENPAEMIKGIVTIAPKINLRVALWNLVDYIDEEMILADNNGKPALIGIEDILEVISQSMVTLAYDLDDGFRVGGQGDNETDNQITTEEIEKFRKLLGIDPDENNKEEN
jgi:hypothetical protein